MTEKQTTRHLLMVEPAGFDYNPSTAPSNPYQIKDDEDKNVILKGAITEMRNFRDALVAAGVHITTVRGAPQCPDHIFPNWFSTHAGREMVVYPMLTDNRAAERTPDILETLQKHYDVSHDLTGYEAENRCLEGVSSLILDRVNKIAYGTLSARTDEKLAYEWCEIMGYTPVIFQSHCHTGGPVYHSDVMMHIGKTFAAICSAAIDDADRDRVMESLSKHHDIIDLEMPQLQSFSGNALEVIGSEDKPLVLMSQSGYDALTQAQKEAYLRHVDGFVTEDLSTIQHYGGGAARCMVQELF